MSRSVSRSSWSAMRPAYHRGITLALPSQLWYSACCAALQSAAGTSGGPGPFLEGAVAVKKCLVAVVLALAVVGLAAVPASAAGPVFAHRTNDGGTISINGASTVADAVAADDD